MRRRRRRKRKSERCISQQQQHFLDAQLYNFSCAADTMQSSQLGTNCILLSVCTLCSAYQSEHVPLCLVHQAVHFAERAVAILYESAQRRRCA